MLTFFSLLDQVHNENSQQRREINFKSFSVIIYEKKKIEMLWVLFAPDIYLQWKNMQSSALSNETQRNGETCKIVFRF